MATHYVFCLVSVISFLYAEDKWLSPQVTSTIQSRFAAPEHVYESLIKSHLYDELTAKSLINMRAAIRGGG